MTITETLIFSFPGYEKTAEAISKTLSADIGNVTFRSFPDGESYVRLDSDVRGRRVILVCGLDHPDQKIMGILFFSKVVREGGAFSLLLVAPYLGYMRQDMRFHSGEAVTSQIFAELLSGAIDGLVTVDPHLHRYASLDEIYSVPSRVVSATGLISAWIGQKVVDPVLIGPDEESDQWVSQVAKRANAPYLVLRKIRRGDRDIEISVPDVEKYQSYTPVLVDDIISTARTMIGTVELLLKAGMNAPICIGTHGIFAEDAHDLLISSGAGKIVTCDSLQHPTNEIALGGVIADQLATDLSKGFFR